ncbi:MAG: glycosyltransferase family 4 protein [Longimicrobiales bacterium]
MRVVQISAQRDPQARAPGALLEAWPTLLDAAAAVARAGAQVTVVQASHVQQRLERDGVAFEFVPVRHTSPAVLAAAAARFEPTVLHLHGLHFTDHIEALAAVLPGTPLLVQDHADAVPRRWQHAAWRRAFRRATGLAFAARAQSLPFVRAGLIPATMPVFPLPESATHFRAGDSLTARSTLGIEGDPVVVWVGRLNQNKDPITALRGFACAAQLLPQARLWMCYSDAPLLKRVRSLIANHPTLQKRVHLLGALSHDEVELLVRAADLLVAASRRESSGYALLEALACGAAPIVSDIPAFRALLADGAVGALFRPGDDAALARELVRLAQEDRTALRSATRRHFEDQLSFAALGRRTLEVYDALLAAPSRSATFRLAVPPDSSATRPRVSRPAIGQAPLNHHPLFSRRLSVALVVPGGVDRSGTERVIPCLLWLIERLARQVDLHVIALRQEAHATTYPLFGAAVHCLPAGASRLQVLRELLQLHHTYDFDLWHALWMHPQGTLVGLAGVLTRRPVLLHINGGDLAALPDIAFGGRVTVRGRLWLRLAVAAAAHVTVPSFAMQRSARALGIAAEVVTLGVATDRWPVRLPRSRAPNEPARLLHVASLNRVKDQRTLLRALATLHGRGVPFLAHLIGQDTLGGAVQRLAGQLELDCCVKFHGALPHDRLRPFFDDAHALVLSSRHEADPVVALEAAIAGLPTVGTEVGHLVDWAPAAAVAVPVGQADALASALQTLLADDDHRLAIARNAQQRALALDADTGAARVLKIYQMLVSGKVRSAALAPH